MRPPPRLSFLLLAVVLLVSSCNASPSSSRPLLTPRGGEQRKWTDDLPPMPSEPPPPPPDLPSEVMGGRGKSTPLPGKASPHMSTLEKKRSWRGTKKAEVDTEEDYGFGTASNKAKKKTNLRPPARQPSNRSGGAGQKWSAVSENKGTDTSNDTPSTLRQSLSVQQKLLTGGASRAVAQFLLYPVDALRTLAQTRDHRALADVGGKALVRGCATTSSFAMFIGSIQFGIFGATRNLCGPVIASAMGAAGSCLVSVPQEVIKQRLVTGIYSGFRDACSTIYKNDGIRGFYSAWRPTMARNVPFVVATFTANDFMKQKLIKRRRLRQGKNWAGAEVDTTNELTIGENLLVGIFSSLIGAVLTHPADVVKTRMMTQAASTQVPYSSATDCILTMFKTEGVPAFYSGFVQRSLYMGPLWSLQFAINGRLCKSLEERNRRRAIS